MRRYEIAFSGQLVSGAEPARVKANLAKLFQADEQRIALLFSGRRIVIKTDLDADTAEKYRSTIERAGAIVEVAESAGNPVAAPLTSQPAAIIPMVKPPAGGPASAPPAADNNPSRSSATPSPSRKVLPRDEYMAAFSNVEAPDFDIAPVGVDLLDDKTVIEEPQLDLSAFSLAPVGSDMGQQKKPPADPAPDTSHIKLAP